MNPPVVCHICQWVHQFLCLLRLLALFPTGGASHPRQGTVLSVLVLLPIINWLFSAKLIWSSVFRGCCSHRCCFIFAFLLLILGCSHPIWFMNLWSLLSSISQSQWIGFLMMDHISQISMVVDPYCIWSDLRLHEAPRQWMGTNKKPVGFLWNLTHWFHYVSFPIGWLEQKTSGFDWTNWTKPQFLFPPGLRPALSPLRWRSRPLANKRPMASHDLLPGTQMGSFASMRLGVAGVLPVF